MQPSIVLIAVALLSSTLLTSCSSRKTHTPGTAYAKLSLSHLEKQTFVSQGDLDMLFMQTRFAEPEEKNRVYLTIGRSLTLNSQYTLARTVLENITLPTAADQQEKDSLLAHVYLNSKQYDKAYQAIRTLTNTPASNTVHYKMLLAWYYFEKGSFSSYLLAIHDAAQQIDHPQIRKSLLHTAWKSIQMATDLQIQQLQAHPNSILQGWVSLRALVDPSTNSNLIQSPKQTYQQLQAWHLNHPHHPAIQLFKPNFAHLTVPEYQKIGLILPTSGQFGKASGLIQKGIFSAFFTARPPQQSIAIYDSAQKNTAHLYQQATADSAQAIIGPLAKIEAQQLLSQTTLTVPTLILNEIASSNPLLMQYSLGSHQEISQLISNMSLSGYLHPLVLNDNTPLAQSIASDFSNQITQNGGLVIESAELDPSHFNQSISSALGTDHSNLRSQFIQSLSPEAIRSVTNKRLDVDSIFVAGDPKNIRQIIPLLKYHYSGDLPIFSTSSINASSSTHKNKDLSAALFFDTTSQTTQTQSPLQARFQQQIMKKIQADQPTQFYENFRFYGLGIDAYLITQTAYLWDILDGYLIFGVNGLLSKDDQGKIHRELSRLTFKNGMVAIDHRFNATREQWKAHLNQTLRLP